MEIGIIEAGYGNIPSLSRVLKQIECKPVVVRTPEDLNSLQKVIIPGVGAFPKAMDYLKKSGLEEAITEFVATTSNSLLGICLGAQLLFESSNEGENVNGLGLIHGRVTRLHQAIFPFRVPHTGWSETIFTRDFWDFHRNQVLPFYYNHSYFFDCPQEIVVSRLHVDALIPTGISQNNIHAFQFHPEKSLEQGRSILESFIFSENV